MSDWITIDRLGVLGAEPDMMPVHRQPHSLDEAMNVRALGANLANAGGYTAVSGGDLPDTIYPGPASNCGAPDRHLSQLAGNGTVFLDGLVDGFWQKSATRNRAIGAMLVNAGGEQYDQRLVMRTGQCNTKRLERTEFQVLNTLVSGQRIKILQYNDAGDLTMTRLDYDASGSFGGGAEQWVLYEQNADNLVVNLNALNIYSDTFSQQYVDTIKEFIRENSAGNAGSPIAQWAFSQTLWDCLVSGTYNGPGGHPLIDGRPALAWNRTDTTVDIDLYVKNRVATGKTGSASSRVAYLDHRKITGKIYWEHFFGLAGCRADNNRYCGAADEDLDLGVSPPGSVQGSFGYTPDAQRLFVNGVDVSQNLTQNEVIRFALDADSGELWYGTGDTDGTASAWGENAVPGTDPAPANIFSDGNAVPAYVPRIAVRIFTTGDTHQVLSSAASCSFAAPAGFAYLL